MVSYSINQTTIRLRLTTQYAAVVVKQKNKIYQTNAPDSAIHNPLDSLIFKRLRKAIFLFLVVPPVGCIETSFFGKNTYLVDLSRMLGSQTVYKFCARCTA